MNPLTQKDIVHVGSGYGKTKFTEQKITVERTEETVQFQIFLAQIEHAQIMG
jgi:hypothetical protein